MRKHLRTINGSNAVFTLNFAPSPPAALDLYLNGLLMTQGVDYTVSSNVVTFFLGSTPQIGDVLTANYRYANPNNPLGTLTSPQVICSTTGSSTSAAGLTQLGSCTIPAGLLGVGDRIEVDFQYTHTGTTTGFTGAVLWAGTSVLSRAGGAGEPALSGRMTFGLGNTAQSWDTQSWGSTLALATSAGSASAIISQNLTISLQGQMAGATSDSVNLSNFTVIRYPAQVNP